MAKVEKFEDLEIWKDSLELSKSIYKEFSKCKYYSLSNQIQRASVSIPSNIAERFERQSNKKSLCIFSILQKVPVANCEHNYIYVKI